MQADTKDYLMPWMTPLSAAVFLKSVRMVRVLLNMGANPDKQDSIGFGALHWAIYTANTEIFLMVVDAGASWTLEDNQGTTPMDLCLLLEDNTVLKDAYVEKGIRARRKS
jgi:ankyrin repeat protein